MGDPTRRYPQHLPELGLSHQAANLQRISLRARLNMKKLCLSFLLFVTSLASAQIAHPTVYIDAKDGFDTYISAAITQKNVPVDVVTDQTKATLS